jgi:polyhydroxybutyrate depolymerase
MRFISVTLFFLVIAACLVAFVSASVFRSSSNDIAVGGMNGPVIFSRPEGQRFFYFYVPSTYTPTNPLPLIVYFHGYRSNWTQGVELNHTVDAETNGYIIAFGAGTPSAETHHFLGWNGGTCCLFNTTIPVDDVTYAKLIVALIVEQVAIATDRVFAMGWSNGGFMVERLGCEAWDVFSGVAADASEVILGNGYEDGLARCDAAFKGGQIDYIHFHGTIDTIVPWVGGHDTRERLPSTLENLSRWVARNGCDNVQMQTYNDGKNFTNIRWPNCRSNTSVELMTVWNAPHAWWTVDNSDFSTADYVMKSFTRGFVQRQNVKSQLTRQFGSKSIFYKWFQ